MKRSIGGSIVNIGSVLLRPHLVSERSHHALSIMDKKEHLDEFLQHFR